MSRAPTPPTATPSSSVASGERIDVRRVEAGDTVAGGHAIRIEPAIEIGNIFKLGTRYSEPLGATYLDESGREQAIVMGSYGIGPARIAAAAVEQFADDKGISWPRAIAPWDVHLVALGKAEHARASGRLKSCTRRSPRPAWPCCSTIAMRASARS